MKFIHRKQFAFQIWNGKLFGMSNVDDEYLAINGAALYQNWLKADSARDVASKCDLPTPSELLTRVMATHTPAGADGATVSALEAMVLNLAEMAVRKDKWAMEKVYNELEHQGIQKHAVAVQHELSPAMKLVLEEAGLLGLQQPKSIVNAEDVGGFSPYAPESVAQRALEDDLL